MNRQEEIRTVTELISRHRGGEDISDDLVQLTIDTMDNVAIHYLLTNNMAVELLSEVDSFDKLDTIVEKGSILDVDEEELQEGVLLFAAKHDRLDLIQASEDFLRLAPELRRELIRESIEYGSNSIINYFANNERQRKDIIVEAVKLGEDPGFLIVDRMDRAVLLNTAAKEENWDLFVRYYQPSTSVYYSLALAPFDVVSAINQQYPVDWQTLAEVASEVSNTELLKSIPRTAVNWDSINAN